MCGEDVAVSRADRSGVSLPNEFEATSRSAPSERSCSCGPRIFSTRQLWHAVLPQLRNCVEEISDLKFSPDDHKLAVGSFDGVIDVYDVLNAFR